MAVSKNFQLLVTVAFRDSGLARGAKGAAGAVGGLAGKTRTLSQRLRGLQQSATGIFGRSGSFALAGAAAALPIKQALDDFTSLDRQVRYTAKTASQTYEEAVSRLGKIQQDGIELARELGTPAIDTLKAMQEVARKGLPADELKDYTKVAMQAAIALDSFESPDDVVTTVGKLANAFQELGVEGFSRVANALNEADKAYDTNARQIANLATRAVGLRQILGLTSVDVINLSSVLLENAVLPEAAGSALTKFSREMKANAEDFGAALGINERVFRQLVEADPMKAIRVFADRFEQLPSLEGIDVLEELGLDAVRLDRVIRVLPSAFKKLDYELSRNNDKFGRVARAYRENKAIGEESMLVQEDLQSEFTRLGTEVTVMRNKFVQANMEGIRGFTGGLKGMFRGLGELDPSMQRFLGSTLAILAGTLLVGGTLGFLLTNTIAFFRPLVWIASKAKLFKALGWVFLTMGKSVLLLGKGVKFLIGPLGTVLRLIGSAVMANPVLAAIAGVATLAYLITTHFDEIKQAWEILWEGNRKVLTDALKQTAIDIGDFLTGGTFTQIFDLRRQIEEAQNITKQNEAEIRARTPSVVGRMNDAWFAEKVPLTAGKNAAGGSFIATGPTSFIAGEGGRAEKVSVTPLASGGGDRGTGSITVNLFVDGEKLGEWMSRRGGATRQRGFLKADVAMTGAG